MTPILYRCIYRLLVAFEVRRNHLMDKIYTEGLRQKLDACGHDVRFLYPVFISNPESVRIGNNVQINRGAFIRSSGGLTIGDNVYAARNLTIYTVNHNYSGTALPFDDTIIKKSVVIKKNVWIGINVTIIPGVTIGEGAIIGAGSIVSNDVPPLGIVGSAPLRIIRYRDNQHYSQLEANQSYFTWSEYTRDR